MGAGGGAFTGYDTSTGYLLTTLTTGVAPTTNFSFYGPTAGWAQTPVAAGVYLFSFLFKANVRGLFTLGYAFNGQFVYIARKYFDAADSYQRLWFPFYFPGSPNTYQFTGAIWSVPANTVTSIGLPWVNKGRVPAPYNFPGNITTQGFLPCAPYGPSVTGPTNGIYKAGDAWILHRQSPVNRIHSCVSSVALPAPTLGK
jgi:hypothetical protein